jgi:transposase
MNRIPRARYSKGMRGVAANLSRSIGPSEASRRLSIPLKTLANWMGAANAGKLSEVGKQQSVASEAELEQARIKRDLLKKFAADFAKEPR